MALRVIIACVVNLAASAAIAGTWEPYSDGAFNAAMDKGRVVILQFTAQECDICGDQERVLKRLLPQPDFRDILGFSVDFDAFRQVVLRWRISGRSTLLLLRDRQEISRVVGVVSERDILAFLKRALPEKVRGRPKRRPVNHLDPRP